MNNPILISTAAYDGYDLATAFKEIARAGAALVEVAFIEGSTHEIILQVDNPLQVVVAQNRHTKHRLRLVPCGGAA